jgi:hypothetical protein
MIAGCSAVTPPPPSPTAIQIAAAASDLKASGISPGDYASIGVTLAGKNCADWFSSQAMNAQGTAFGTSALSMLGGAASMAGGPAGAGIGAGASLLASLLGQAQASFGAGSNPTAVYSLVRRVQQAWIEAMPTPLTEADAFALVEDFAQKCELPGILTAVADAMHAVDVTAVAPAIPVAQNAADQSVAAIPRRMRLPVVRIGSPRQFMLAQEPTPTPKPYAYRANLSREHDAIKQAGGRNAYEGGPRDIPPPILLHPPSPPAPIIVSPLSQMTAEPEPSDRAAIPPKPVEPAPPDRVMGQPIQPDEPRNFFGTR